MALLVLPAVRGGRHNGAVRVLVVAKDFPAPGQPDGGIVVFRQVQALARLGHQILIVRIVPRAPGFTTKWRAYRSIPDRYTIEGIDVETVRAVLPPRMLGMEYLPVQVDQPLRRIVARFKPDVIHAHCLIPSGQLAVRHFVPTVITAHGSDAYDWPWRRSGLERAAREGVARAAEVVAVSDFIRTHVVALVDRDVSVVYNGADEAVFHPRDRFEARNALGIDPSRRVIAFAGRATKSKGTFDLIKAAGTLRDFDPLLILAGSVPDAQAIDELAASCGVEVRRGGMLSHAQLAQTLGAADVFCLPSYAEGLPLALCEAMLSARPVVTTPVGGIPEIVDDGHNGFLVPPGDASMLAAKLRTLLDDSELAASMAAKGYERARRSLTWEANVARYCELYERAARAAA